MPASSVTSIGTVVVRGSESLEPSAASQVYKVQVGRYNDRNEAERVSKRLEKEEKFNPWISR